MVKKGEYVNFANQMEVKDIDLSKPEIIEIGYTTEMNIIIELTHLVKSLEERIIELEKI